MSAGQNSAAFSRRALLVAGASSAFVVTGAAHAMAADNAASTESGELVDSSTPADSSPAVDTSHTSLVFSDEFSADSLNTDRWSALETDRGTGNNGVEYWYRPENVSIGDRGLDLAISQLGSESYGGSRIDSSGKFSFTFGTVEVRAAVPPTVGHLGAIWLQAANGLTPDDTFDGTARDGAEIDIMESFATGDQYSVALHWDGYGSKGKSWSKSITAAGLHDSYAFHVYTTEWTSTALKFYYDGTLVQTVTDSKLISQVAEFPILSNEVIGYAKGDIHDVKIGPETSTYVDYIRIWQ